RRQLLQRDGLLPGGDVVLRQEDLRQGLGLVRRPSGDERFAVKKGGQDGGGGGLGPAAVRLRRGPQQLARIRFERGKARQDIIGAPFVEPAGDVVQRRQVLVVAERRPEVGIVGQVLLRIEAVAR